MWRWQMRRFNRKSGDINWDRRSSTGVAESKLFAASQRLALPVKTILVIAILLLSSPLAAQTPDLNSLVEPEVIADVSQFKAGEPFKLGIKFRIREGWHIYWGYPGELGLATKVNIEAIEGVKFSELKYPVPETFKQINGVDGYGYSKETLLYYEVTADKIAAFDPKIKISWLACGENSCVPGRKELGLKIPVGDKSILVNHEFFTAYESNFPPHVTAADSPVKVSTATIEGATIKINLEWAQAPKSYDILLMLPDRTSVIKKNLPKNISGEAQFEVKGNISALREIRGVIFIKDEQNKVYEFDVGF